MDDLTVQDISIRHIGHLGLVADKIDELELDVTGYQVIATLSKDEKNSATAQQKGAIYLQSG